MPIIPGITRSASNLKRKKKSAWYGAPLSFDMAMVARGSPTGVKAAPRPTAKQVTTVIFTFLSRSTGIAAITSERITAETITDITLETTLKTRIMPKTKGLIPILFIRFIMLLYITSLYLYMSIPATSTT